jgi:hypothetical protein
VRELQTLEMLRGARNPESSHAAAASAVAFCHDARGLLLALREDYGRRRDRAARRG